METLNNNKTYVNFNKISITFNILKIYIHEIVSEIKTIFPYCSIIDFFQSNKVELFFNLTD